MMKFIVAYKSKLIQICDLVLNRKRVDFLTVSTGTNLDQLIPKFSRQIISSQFFRDIVASILYSKKRKHGLS